MEGLTKEHIQEAIEQVLNSPRENEERHIRYTQYCKTYGTITRNSRDVFPNYCQDVECTNCQNFYKVLNEEIRIQLKEWAIKLDDKDEKLKL